MANEGGDVGAAMLLDATTQNGDDALTRFVRSLSNASPTFLQREAEHTIKLRREFEVHWTQLVLAREPDEAAIHAEWIATNVREIAYRWSHLLWAAREWHRLDSSTLVRWPR